MEHSYFFVLNFLYRPKDGYLSRPENRENRDQNSLPTGTLTELLFWSNTVMFTFDDRYRPLRFGAKFVYMS